MNQEIIRMAQEAGNGDEEWLVVLRSLLNHFPDEVERFFHLAQAAEREACARIAEEWLGPTKDRELHIAAAIRARGQE
jgi:hypothetical protein